MTTTKSPSMIHALTPIIDRFTQPRIFGAAKKEKAG